MVIGASIYAYYVYDSVKETASFIHEPIERNQEDRPKPKIQEAKEPITILLMGVDQRKGDQGRSDSMVVMTLNPSKESMYMFNIPRDSRTKIIGKGFEDKINHAYAFGGTKMAIETVENFIDVPIDYYIKVNMQSFSDIVDAVGGVKVQNKLSWYDSGYYRKGYKYERGEIFLDGAKALGYVRMRYQDPRGDFGRNERQRQVIKAVINKGAQFSSITKFDDILDVISSNVKTNMTFDEMKDIQANYKKALNDIKTFEINGQGTKINKIYYYIVSEQERESISTKLKEHLEMSTNDKNTQASE